MVTIWLQYRLPVTTNNAGRYQRSDDIDLIIGEALTNLYVGLCRFQRGEHLSAMKFVQSFALDRLVDLIHLTEPNNQLIDKYMPDRRLESRYPETKTLLESFCQGYARTPQSALAQLNWLQHNFTVNACIAREVRRLVALSS